MKRVAYAFAILCAVAPGAVAPAGAQQAPAQQPVAAGLTGAWAVPDTPWSIVLKQDGATLSGKVVQGVQEVEIYEAKVDGTTVSFKAEPPTRDRIITFVGKVSDDEIAFTRTVQIKEGGAPGGNALLGGPAGPPEFKAVRAAPDIDVWSGTVRNAPNPNAANAPPAVPRPVTVGVRKLPDPHWRWRGEGKTIDTRVFVQNNQPTPLASFVLDGDQLTFDYNQGPQALRWVCSLTRQADGQFLGGCRPETGNNPGLFITLTPPKESARQP